MHGLLHRALQYFVREAHGPVQWEIIAREVGLENGGFEAFLDYDPQKTELLFDIAADQLGIPPIMLMEDLGTFMISHPGLESLRRLMRFGGDSFLEFVYSLEDLPGRARLAVPDLDVPELELEEDAAEGFVLHCRGGWPGLTYVLQGVLRAMADDYGALVYLDVLDYGAGDSRLGICLLDTRFAEGRAFSLRAPKA
jgi:hypothetical protein